MKTTRIEIKDVQTGETEVLTNDNEFGPVQAFSVARAAEEAQDAGWGLCDKSAFKEAISSFLIDNRLDWKFASQEPGKWTIRIDGNDIRVGLRDQPLRLSEFKHRCSEFRSYEYGD